jgi:hypothetical protein
MVLVASYLTDDGNGHPRVVHQGQEHLYHPDEHRSLVSGDLSHVGSHTGGGLASAHPPFCLKNDCNIGVISRDTMLPAQISLAN